MKIIQITKKNKYSTKDIAKWIRQTLKKEIPHCKFSVRIATYSGGSSISLNLMESNKIRILKKTSEVTEQDIASIMSARNDSEDIVKEFIKSQLESESYTINQYHFETDWGLTTKGKELIGKVLDIAQKHNWDKSDLQTDYFDVNYYLSINLGQYDKPFIDGSESVKTDDLKTTKKQIKEIRLLLAEGKVPYTQERVFVSFKDANDYLVAAGRRALAGGGYDKHKIQLTWEDGEVYTGRWDVTNEGEDTNIKKHIVDFLTYVRDKDETTTLKEKKEINEWLENYSLEDKAPEVISSYTESQAIEDGFLMKNPRLDVWDECDIVTGNLIDELKEVCNKRNESRVFPQEPLELVACMLNYAKKIYMDNDFKDDNGKDFFVVPKGELMTKDIWFVRNENAMLTAMLPEDY